LVGVCRIVCVRCLRAPCLSNSVRDCICIEGVADGLVEEARRLYPKRALNALQTVGYRELFDAFDGLTTIEEAIELIKRNSRRYAKRQLTWFRRDCDVAWFAPSSVGAIIEHIDSRVERE
ncbi:MAG: hypothetical protein IKC57_07325, partial [Alistipes sp.]|nr:hypothetical protein [Alistipes sp.]